MARGVRIEGLDAKIRRHVSEEIEVHGHALVTINGLAEKFGHSNSTIHAQLRKMERDGKLISHPGRKGCYHEVKI